MSDDGQAAFEALSTRLIRREALRRAAAELSTNTPSGLEATLARVSAEVTAEAAEAKAAIEKRRLERPRLSDRES